MEKRDHSLSVRFQSMVEIEIVSILIGQRENLRDKDLSGNQLLINSSDFKPIKIGLKITLG